MRAKEGYVNRDVEDCITILDEAVATAVGRGMKGSAKTLLQLRNKLSAATLVIGDEELTEYEEV